MLYLAIPSVSVFLPVASCTRRASLLHQRPRHTWQLAVGNQSGLHAFSFPNSSITHTPDLDINFGIGDRIQLTYESAWLRVADPSPAKFGLGQDQLGFKWRFLDNKASAFAMSLFPQVSINNPNDSVARGITPRGASLILPLEFSKKLGPIDLNWEVGYNLVHKGNAFLVGMSACFLGRHSSST
jgi:hypothetical protein